MQPGILSHSGRCVGQNPLAATGPGNIRAILLNIFDSLQKTKCFHSFLFVTFGCEKTESLLLLLLPSLLPVILI